VERTVKLAERNSARLSKRAVRVLDVGNPRELRK